MMKPLLIFSILLIFQVFAIGQTSGDPSGVQDLNYDTTSLIVRLNPKLLDWNVIDDESILYTNVGDLLNQHGKDVLSEFNFTAFELESVGARKVFPNLLTKDSISLGRQGQKVFVPPFWATFSLEVPDGVRYIDLVSEIRTKFPLVIYSHPSYYIEPTSCFPQLSDTLYNNQNTIHDNGSGFANIHVDSAWCVETGDRYIKVGIFDTGIDSTHEDLEVLTGRAANNFLGTDFQTGQIVYPKWGEDWNNHGTKVAGIIGAKRNNVTGIAGIAGGDGTDTSGVSLLDFRFTDNGGGNINNIELFSALIVDAARFVGSYYDWSSEFGGFLEVENLPTWENSVGYGIHLGNHSYAIRLGNAPKNEDDPSGGGVPGGYFESCNLCYESFLFSLKNGVINVAASGNKKLETGVTPENFEIDQYPSAYDDSWLIRVGSSAFNGDVLVGGQNSNNTYFSIWGDNVDVIAPGDGAYNLSTWSVNDPSNIDSLRYGGFNGTSSAAPHVTGVIALLLSHYNKRMCYSNINLDVADVEYILEKSADTTQSNIVYGGYSKGSGWGRVNAEKAMDMINFPELQIVHPIDSAISQQTLEIDTIVLYYEEPIMETSTGPISAPWAIEINRPYKVIRYKEQLTYDFGQYRSDTTELLDAWIRHSQTNSLQRFEDTLNDNQTGQNVIITDYFRQDPTAIIDTIINDSLIQISGYYYHFIARYNTDDIQLVDLAAEIPEDVWYPINPFIQEPRMAYSIYIRDTSLVERYDFPCDSLNELLDVFASINDNSFEQDILVYPNPTSTLLNVKLNDNMLGNGIIRLTDISGRTINEQTLTSNKEYTFDVQNLKSGVYLVNLLEFNGDRITKKWIKQ